MENFTRGMLLDEGAPFLNHCTSAYAEPKSVPILESEESYVSHLLLKSVKSFFWGEGVHLSVLCRSSCFHCVDVIVFKCSVSSMRYEIH